MDKPDPHYLDDEGRYETPTARQTRMLERYVLFPLVVLNAFMIVLMYVMMFLRW